EPLRAGRDERARLQRRRLLHRFRKRQQRDGAPDASPRPDSAGRVAAHRRFHVSESGPPGAVTMPVQITIVGATDRKLEELVRTSGLRPTVASAVDLLTL